MKLSEALQVLDKNAIITIERVLYGQVYQGAAGDAKIIIRNSYLDYDIESIAPEYVAKYARAGIRIVIAPAEGGRL